MKCGNCKASHDTPEEVRACYGAKILSAVGSSVAPSTIEPNWNRLRELSGKRHEHRGGTLEIERTAVPAQLFAPVVPATQKQKDYLNKLLAARPGFRDIENLWPDRVETLSKEMASAKIKETLEVAAEVIESHWSASSDLTSLLEGVDDGYFALPSKSGTNDLDFIRISSNQGRVNAANKGKRRVNRFLGGHGNIDIRISEQIEFAKIVVAISIEERREANARFGREIGRCGVCGKSLTDEISRAEGLGPICRGR